MLFQEFSKSKTLIVIVSMVATVSGSVDAATFDIGSVTGAWTGVQPPSSSTNVTGIGTSTVRWGIPFASVGGAGEQSGYSFTGTAQGGGYEGENEFDLGTFTHLNNTINNGTSITGADLALAFTVSVGGLAKIVSAAVHFDHFETPNTAVNTGSCANGGTLGVGVNSNGCADRVRIDNSGAGENNFVIDGINYVLEVTGFSTGGQSVSEFWTREQAANTATLQARIKKVEIIPAPINDLSKPNFDFVGDLAGDVGTEFDPSKPTIVLTHGWQRDGAYSGTIGNTPFTSDLYDAIKSRLGSDVNVVAFVWQDAYFESPTSISGVSDKILADIGLTLGLKLKNLAGSQYDLPIQFIGHSLGSEVNVVAAQFLDARQFNVAQVTTLDAPIGRKPLKIPVAPYALITKSVNIDLLDNYYGTQGSTFYDPLGKLGAFGGPIAGWSFDGGQAYDTDHSGVWKEYLNTINDISSTSGFYFSVALGQTGGFYTATEDANRGEPAVYNTVLAKLEPTALVHANFDATSSTLALSTGSNGYASFQIEKPDSITSLLFDLSFSEAGLGDFLEVVIDNELLGTFSAELYKDFASTIFLDIEKFSPGFHEMYFLLVNQSQEYSQLKASNFRYFQPVAAEVAPIPLPPSGILILLGIAGLALLRTKKTARPISFQPS